MVRKQRTMEADQLQELLQKCFSEGNDADWRILRIELEKVENKVLRDELFRLGWLEADDFVANEIKMWESILRYHEQEQKRLRVRRLWRYAAAIFIPLLIGSLFFWTQHLKEVSEAVPVSLGQLEPGNRQAILKLGDGELIDLTTVGRDTLLTRNGVTIRLDSSRSVSYQGEIVTGHTVDYNTIIVPRGGEYRLVLADGSVVWLNADSELKFPIAFHGDQRKVFLKGEAYFDVVKNPALPFVVDVAGMEVKVLGTCFNVNAYREDGVFQTTLVSGKVEVHNIGNAERVTLLPDQQAQLKNGHLFVSTVDASACVAWINGKFYFESESLLEIAAQLERWYDVDFFFAREELKHYEFTGVIRRDYTANQILDMITKTTNVHFEIKGRTVVVN